MYKLNCIRIPEALLSWSQKMNIRLQASNDKCVGLSLELLAYLSEQDPDTSQMQARDT